jgi:hypothetical protein
VIAKEINIGFCEKSVQKKLDLKALSEDFNSISHPPT